MSEKNYSAKFKIPPKKKGEQQPLYTTSMRKWLEKPLEFDRIDGAEFKKGYVLATVPFDKDHIIYVLIEEEVFKSK